MKNQLISSNDPAWLNMAIVVLEAGGLVSFPTDTVYGLGAKVFNDHAVEKIYDAKGRPDNKAIPVLIGDIADLELVCSNVPDMAKELASYFWPGPLTLVVPKHPGIPEIVSSTESIGVRIPDHPVARKLLKATGPLAVSSANRSGKQSTLKVSEVLEQLYGRIDLIIDGGHGFLGTPSTVVNCMGSDPVVLREGPITLAQLNQALGK